MPKNVLLLQRVIKRLWRPLTQSRLLRTMTRWLLRRSKEETSQPLRRDMSMSLLHWDDQKWTQYSRYGLTSVH